MECRNCGGVYETRNRLFKHLRECKGSKDQEKSQEKEEDHHLKRLKVIHEILGKQHQQQKEEEEGGEDRDRRKGEIVVYVMGGRLRGRTLSAVHKYSIKENKWEICQPMLENRGSHGAICVNGRIYVVGGGGLKSNLSTCESFDGVQWVHSAPLNVSRHALSVTSIGDKIYACGGWVDGTLCSGAVEVLDTTLNDLESTWSVLPPLILPRRLHGVASYGSKLFVFGGSCDDPHWHTDTAEVLDTSSFSSSSSSSSSSCSQWTQLPTRIPASGGMSAVSVYPFIYLFLHGKNVCRYDPEADSYTTLSSLPVLDWHCFDAKGAPPENIPDLSKVDYPTPCEGLGTTHIYVIGGASLGVWGSFAYCYNIFDDSWSQLAAMPQAKRRLACAIVREPLRGCGFGCGGGEVVISSKEENQDNTC